ncbi:RelA/SpoT domain-containing protein [Brachybacterium paraconglomeratum]|uniref:RelA/SpoT domain-containing protein n=1 Tax=Brachybacterium paraconglomeratum TaxID=173362 RepID=UPI003824FD0D
MNDSHIATVGLTRPPLLSRTNEAVVARSDLELRPAVAATKLDVAGLAPRFVPELGDIQHPTHVFGQAVRAVEPEAVDRRPVESTLCLDRTGVDDTGKTEPTAGPLTAIRAPYRRGAIPERALLGGRMEVRAVQFWRRHSHGGKATYPDTVSYPQPPETSKRQLKKAGKLLATNSAPQHELDAAQLLVDQFRAAHHWPMLTARVTLDRRAKSISPQALVVQRLKRMPSIIDKLQGGRVKDVSTMQDLGGCRAILPKVDQVYNLSSLYLDSGRHTAFRFALKNDYIQEPKPNGYRGVHLVGVYNSKSAQQDGYNGYTVELQLRTQLMHAWATAVEIVDTFENVGLKSSRPDEFNSEWDYFFAFAGAAISLREGTPVPPGVPDTKAGITEAMKKMDADRLLRRLMSWSSSMRHVSRRGERGTHFILSLDSERRIIRMRQFKNSGRADEEYRNLEAESRANSVLVGGKSMEEIRKAYPNYFVDTRRFSRILRELLK